MEWVLCKDKLPNVNTEVLMYDNGDIEIGEYDGFGRWDNREAQYFHPTHWMEFPEKPKR